jgi:heptosyltransferase-1
MEKQQRNLQLKILIVRLSALGDIVHSAVVLEFIKRYKPDAKIDWLVDKRFKSILENSIYIDKLYSLDLKGEESSFEKISNVIKKSKFLKSKKYDYIIDMQGLLKSSILARLIGKNTYGFSWKSAREGASSLLYKKKSVSNYNENKILRNVQLINDALNLKISKDEVLNKRQHLFYSDTTFSSNEKVLFVVGSSMAQKNYPKEKFLELAQLLDRQISIIWGSLEERKLAVWIANRCSNVELAPKMNLDQLKHYIFTSSLVIGNDSGPTHIAWAMNIPSIVLFGMTPPEQMLVTEINRYLKSDSVVNPSKLQKSDFSIGDIKAEDIMEIVKELDEKKGS